MSSISNYLENNPSNPVGQMTQNNIPQKDKIRAFVRNLHNSLPIVEKEFEDLEKRNKSYPNNIFPIKMEALATVYKAANVLYEWYVTKDKQRELDLWK